MLERGLKLYSWFDGLMRCGFLVCEWSGIVIWNFLLILQLVMLLWSYFSLAFDGFLLSVLVKWTWG